MSALRERILEVLREAVDPASLSVDEIAARLRGRPPRRAQLTAELDRLVAEERAVLVRGLRYADETLAGTVVGRFIRHERGFGFVSPDDGSKDDVFVPPRSQRGALHGDVVAVEILDDEDERGRSGRVVAVVERRGERLMGVFHRRHRGGGIVVPTHPGSGFEVHVPRGQTLDAESGEVVGVRLDGLPAPSGIVPGRVEERLGHPDEPGAEIGFAMRKYGLEEAFPPEVLAEAEALPGDPDGWPIDEREDFRDTCCVTIDGPDAKDFDDAIGVERRPDGGFRLSVHIADVAHFVAEGSELDLEARRRGTSVYLPGRVLPMLPERLSNDLCSLRPDVPRLAHSALIEIAEDGSIEDARFADGVIRSRGRLTYGEAEGIAFDRDESSRARRPREVVEMLDAAADLLRALLRRRADRGALDFEDDEVQIVFGENGETLDIVARSRLEAHRLIEEAMIAANRVVASALIDGRVPALHRIHERPDPLRVARLAERLDAIGYTLQTKDARATPAAFAAVLAEAKGRSEEIYVSRQVLRSLALARYGPEPVGHFGLALSRYAHFTSPIRRYPDLIVHRALRAMRHRKAGAEGERRARHAVLEGIGASSSLREREAESAERECKAWRVAAFMHERLGEEYEGTIVDVTPLALGVRLGHPAVEGQLRAENLGGEFMRFDPRRLRLVDRRGGASYRVGQKVRVRVERVDLLRHHVDFALAGEKAAEETPARRPKRRTRRRRDDRRKPGRKGRRR